MGTHHVLTYRAQYKTSGSWVDFPGVLSVETSLETSGGGGPLTFGAATLPRATIDCTAAAPSSGWRRAPVRVWHTVAIDGGSPVEELVFSGLLLRRRPGPSRGWSFTAGSWDQRIARARVRTPLRYYRPLATRTTATSVEDPESGAYRGGILNEIFWKAGGRPSDQTITYPSAEFYYSCDGTSVAPEWSWVDGENPWNEALTLAESAGGQIYVDAGGVVRYVNPLRLAEAVGGAPVIADRSGVATGAILYDGEIEVDEDTEAAFNAATCSYKRRALQPRQEIYKARDPFAVEASADVTRELAMQWPILWRDLTTGAAIYTVRVTACRYDGAPVTPTITVTGESAQLLELTITNPLAEPILIAEIAVDGRPVSVLQEGQARYVGAKFDANNAEDVERRLPESIYVQSQPAAARRARMAVELEGPPRPLYGLRNLPYTPGVAVGGYARLYNLALGLSDLPVRIVSRVIRESGRSMDLKVVDVSGIRTLAELWVVDEGYAGTDVRRNGL